jgi:glycerophosphoryl diester phosphodiesterase
MRALMSQRRNVRVLMCCAPNAVASATLRRFARARGSLVVTSKFAATARTAAALRASGKELWCYTVDDAAEMRSLIARGVRGIISNRPDLAQRVCARRAELPVRP